MILQELCRLAERKTLPPVGCWKQEVAADIHIDGSGVLRGIVIHKLAKDSQLPRRWFPFLDPTNSGKPSMGVHKLEHLLGRKFVVQGMKHAWSVSLATDRNCASKARNLRDFAAKVALALPNSQQVSAWCSFLNTNDTAGMTREIDSQIKSQASKPPLTSNLYAAIYVDEQAWWQDSEVVSFWCSQGRALSEAAARGTRKAKTARSDGSVAIVPDAADLSLPPLVRAQCLVCGQKDVVERLIPGFDGLERLKDGVKIVPRKHRFTSFNCAAYASRGRRQAYNAPICTQCADRAAKAWNSLLESDSSRLLLDDEVLGFWGDTVLKPWGEQAVDPQVWRALLNSVRTGQKAGIAPEGVSVLGLGAHKATAFVTCWLKKEAEAAGTAILRWWKWQAVLGDQQTEVYNLTELIMALRPRSRWFEKVHLADGRLNTMTSGERVLWRRLLAVSLGVGRVPLTVLSAVVGRLATELEAGWEPTFTPRARPKQSKGMVTNTACFPLDRLVLLNICLCSLNNLEKVEVNRLMERQRNAYNAGRVFSLICYAQRLAVGESGKTLLASNARLAATRPNQVLGELITRLNQIYMPKLRRDNPTGASYIHTQISRLLGTTVFAKAHNIEEQGWFWKGFYHHRSEEGKNERTS
ncbi:MAG: type I-C CRISPR-associated protein Cas8c/Csd1 [Armatimonadetes bacterium]|nr:type I-C CRISPR-associated protein Cas8c/Csd1 [Armatimonadota bacterium]